MSDYADNDDLDTFRKASEAAASSNWQKVEAEYFEGKTIIDVKKLDGGWRLIGTLDGNILDEDYSGIRYTNCYIKVNADDDIDIVFNYGVLFDPNVGEYGANIDQTGEEPIILSGSSGQFTSFNSRTFDVPFINVAVMSENEDVMDITQFIAAPDGREYGFGTLFHKDGTVLNFMLSRP